MSKKMVGQMLLSAEEVRVLGCLIEKSQATPEYYPMTLNALVAACNQKTSRDPVVEYSHEEVEDAIKRLKDKGLCASVSGEGRVIKFVHRGGENGLGLTSAQLAALSILLLRGPQTIGEIKNRSERQHEFPSLEAVEETLNGLMTEAHKFVEKAPRRAGQKEVRYRHLFYAYGDETEEEQETTTAPSLRNEVEELKHIMKTLQDENIDLKDRVAKLEAEVDKIKRDLY
jgi:hypothetical protein